MNPEILEQLKDIHQSAPVGWWPLAWGWWVLVITLVAVLIFSVYSIRQYHLKRVAKKQSLSLLKQIHPQDSNWPVQIHVLLRRVCLTYFPTHNVAQLHGDKWLAFLSAQLSEKHAIQLAPALKQLVMSQYQPMTQTLDFEEVNQCVKQWISLACPAKVASKQKELTHV